MQFANANKLWFILAPSLRRMPRFSVTVPRSEPAKSIKLSFPVTTSTSVFLVLDFEVTFI